jgi:8-oxo-dGTP diphosphatase
MTRERAGVLAVDVAIALVWRDGRLLVTQRPRSAHLGGLWEFPGGKLGDGETPEACAVREVLEETAVECRALSRRTPVTHEYPDRAVTLWPVDCAWQSGEAELREVTAARWLVPGELAPLRFPDANAPLLRELLTNRTR